MEYIKKIWHLNKKNYPLFVFLVIAGFFGASFILRAELSGKGYFFASIMILVLIYVILALGLKEQKE